MIDITKPIKCESCSKQITEDTKFVFVNIIKKYTLIEQQSYPLPETRCYCSELCAVTHNPLLMWLIKYMNDNEKRSYMFNEFNAKLISSNKFHELRTLMGLTEYGGWSIYIELGTTIKKLKDRLADRD